MLASQQRHLFPTRHPPVDAPARGDAAVRVDAAVGVGARAHVDAAARAGAPAEISAPMAVGARAQAGAATEILTPAEADAPAEIHAIAEAINSRLRAHAVRVGPKPTPGPEVVSSGFPALDAITQLGGFPRGRITELIGRATAGRETVAAHAVAAAGGYGAWVDVPGLVDVSYLARCGVDLDRLFILRPEQPADALAITAQVLSSGHFSVVVLDALADLTPNGDTARAVGQLMRVVTPKLGRTPTVAVVLSSPDNHYRPLAHAAALRISLAKTGLIRRGGVFRGWRTRAHILKSPGKQGGECGIEVWL